MLFAVDRDIPETVEAPKDVETEKKAEQVDSEDTTEKKAAEEEDKVSCFLSLSLSLFFSNLIFD